MSTGIKSRLLKRLDAEIEAAPSLVRGASLKARRAVLLARHGQLAQAREQLTGLHQLAFQHPHPEIGAWLHLAEGLMSYYTDFSSAARDKILRAQAIARSAGLPQLQALAAAWLANLAYVRHELAELIAQARHCREIAAPEQHDARYRLEMTLGLAHHFAGAVEPAQACYARARSHAMSEGDDASLSALMYNMAEMRTAQARRASLMGLAGLAASSSGLLAGADSVKHYDAVVGGSVMPGLTPVLRAQILTVEGQFAQARELYETHLPEAMSQGLARLGSSLLAELAWCRVNTGQAEHALQQAREAEVELDPSCDIDDRAATHSRLAQVHAALGDAATAERHSALAAQCWTEFAGQQRAWSAALQEAGF
jgi:tetratricopeptide (TPR) repeat protein